MASKREQNAIRLKSFIAAVRSGDARNAKILLGDGFDWTESEHKAMTQAVGASLAANAAVFTHATQAYPELLLDGPSERARVATPHYTPPSPAQPILSAFSDALRDSAEFGDDGVISFSAPARFHELSGSAVALARWLAPLLANNPDWAQPSIKALPGIFWHFLPALDREAFFNAVALDAEVSHGVRVSAALGAMRHGMALNWSEAYQDGETQLKAAVAQMPKDVAKRMKAAIGADLLFLGAAAGPVMDHYAGVVRWAATPNSTHPRWAAFHRHQAQTRPALIDSALLFSSQLGALPWTKSPGGSKSSLPSPLSMAALTLNVTAWAFLSATPSAAVKDAHKSKALSLAAGNWSSIPQEAAAIWAHGGGANPNAPFDHSQAPWSDLSQQALFETQLGALSQLYHSQKPRGVSSNGFSSQLPPAVVPDEGIPCARGLARLLFANNPLLRATACDDLILMVSQQRGFDKTDYPNLLAEWLLPAMAWEGAAADFSVEMLEKMGDKAQAQLNMVALRLEVDKSRPPGPQEAARPSARSAKRI